MAARKKKKVAKPNPEYELPKPMFRILALDPGSKNFGISVVGAHQGKPLVLANSTLTKPINTLVDFQPAKDAFLSEIHRWVRVYNPQAIIAERFQTRGNGGPLIELVSVMLGILAGTYPHLHIKFITASTWKNAFNRRFKAELEARFPDAEKADLKLLYPEVRTAPHPFDASLIGVYGLEFGLKKQLSYTPEEIIEQVEHSSCLPLRVIRSKK